MIIILSACSVLFAACGSHQPVQEKNDPEPVKSYFPVQDYIKGEIKIIDSVPVGIMKKFSNGTRKDSGFIDRTEFKRLSGEFTSDQLSKAALEKDYTETAFRDQTSGYFTMTYVPKTTTAPLQRIDVTVKPGELSDHVNSIYVEKEYAQNDTVINERLYWKANTSFRITKEKKFKDQNPVIEQLLVIWDPAAY